MKLLDGYVKEIVNQAQTAQRRLWVFDFDDTLVRTDAKVHVTDAQGKKFDLVPAEFAVYDRLPGDTFDYTDFEKLINPRTIKWMERILHNVYLHHGASSIVIVSARGHEKPIQQFLREKNMADIEVFALNDASPDAKARWIDSRINRDNLHIVEFFDDSHKNVTAVKALKRLHPDVTIIARHIIHTKISSLSRT